MTTDEKYNALLPLAEAMSWASYWIKTEDGPRHVNRPFTYELLRQHAAGVKAFGLCPIKPGESTTRVACLDLDSHKGEVSPDGMLAVAGDLICEAAMRGIKLKPFWSSGGQGIHLYALWERPEPAWRARQVLTYVLNEFKFKPGTAGVAKGEIEIFPKQSEVPLDGYGSMFVLPFAGRSEPLSV